MSRLMRLYYYAVLGAMGGLIGWQASNVVGLSFWSNIYLSEIVVGGLIGLSIGALIGLAEGSKFPERPPDPEIRPFQRRAGIDRWSDRPANC